MRKALGLLALLLFAAAPALSTPYLVVAGTGNSVVTAIDMGTPGFPIVGQQAFGSQTIGVAAVQGHIGLTDFLGGKVIVLTAQPVGDYLGIGSQTIVTSPDLLNPEGIMLASGSWALLTDGISQPGSLPVAVELVDLSAAKKLSQVLLPSAYAAGISRLFGLAFVADGISMQLAVLQIKAGGQLADTGQRIPLSGSPLSPRYVAVDDAGHRVFVSYKLDGAVEVFDIATGASLGVIPNLGAALGAIAITPDNKRALVADYTNSTWAVLDLSRPGLPADTGLRIASPLGVPNTFGGTKTFTFVGDLMCYSATNSNMAVALNWKTLALTDMAVPVGVQPGGMDLSY